LSAHANSNPRCDTHTYCHCYAYSYCHGYAYRHAASDSYTEGSSNISASPLASALNADRLHRALVTRSHSFLSFIFVDAKIGWAATKSSFSSS
jgi:hypothetical protein